MLRLFATAAILSLTLTAAQAETGLSERVHAAAVTACTAQYGNALPLAYYGARKDTCIKQVSSSVLTKLQSDALAKARYTTALAGY